MPKKHSKFLWLIVATLFGSMTDALAFDAVKVTEPDGNETLFLLESHPRVSMENETLLVTTDDAVASFMLEGAIRFEFADYGTTEVAKLSVETPVFKLSKEMLEATHIKPFSTVSVYNLDGLPMKSAQTDQSGYVAIQISDLPNGIYIVNSNSKIFKFYKK